MIFSTPLWLKFRRCIFSFTCVIIARFVAGINVVFKFSTRLGGEIAGWLRFVGIFRRTVPFEKWHNSATFRHTFDTFFRRHDRAVAFTKASRREMEPTVLIRSLFHSLNLHILLSMESEIAVRMEPWNSLLSKHHTRHPVGVTWVITQMSTGWRASQPVAHLPPEQV